MFGFGKFKYDIGDYVIIDPNNLTKINERDGLVEGVILNKKKREDYSKYYEVKVISEGPYFDEVLLISEELLVRKSRDIVIRYPSNLPTFTDSDLDILNRYYFDTSHPLDKDLAALIAKIKYYMTINEFKTDDLLKNTLLNYWPKE